MSHFNETFLWDILMRHFYETFLWDILKRHFDEKFWWEIFMAGYSLTVFLNTSRLFIQLLNFTTGVSNLTQRVWHWLPLRCFHSKLLFEALMKLVQFQWKSFLNKICHLWRYMSIKISVNCFTWAMGSYDWQIQLPQFT